MAEVDTGKAGDSQVTFLTHTIHCPYCHKLVPIVKEPKEGAEYDCKKCGKKMRLKIVVTYKGEKVE